MTKHRDKAASADDNDSCSDDKELNWHGELVKYGVYLLAFMFSLVCKSTQSPFLDQNLSSADLIRDFVMGYGMVRPNENAALSRLM